MHVYLLVIFYFLIQTAWEFINKTGIGKPPQVLMNGVMLKQMQVIF